MPELKEKKEIEEKGLSIESIIEQAGLGKDPAMEAKANENIDITQNSNWYSAYGIVNAIKDLTAKTGNIMPYFAEGDEGSDLPVSYPIPFDITDYFMIGKTAWTDSARPAFNAQQVTDNAETLTQVEFILEMNVTNKMLKHSTDKQLFDKITKKLSKSAVRTQESMIINGDVETGATGNVNSDDQAPATTFGTAQYHSLKVDHGIRESAINNSNTVNVGAFDSDDLVSVRKKLAGRYREFKEDLVTIAENDTYDTMQLDDALKLAANTAKPTIDGGKTVMKPFGVALEETSLVPKTEADGKASATPGNNTLGQWVEVFTPAVRHGYGQDITVEVEKVAGYGFHMVITMEWSFVIMDAANTCAAGINVTV